MLKNPNDYGRIFALQASGWPFGTHAALNTAGGAPYRDNSCAWPCAGYCVRTGSNVLRLSLAQRRAELAVVDAAEARSAIHRLDSRLAQRIAQMAALLSPSLSTLHAD
jgi:hypothetical protein